MTREQIIEDAAWDILNAIDYDLYKEAKAGEADELLTTIVGLLEDVVSSVGDLDAAVEDDED